MLLPVDHFLVRQRCCMRISLEGRYRCHSKRTGTFNMDNIYCVFLHNPPTFLAATPQHTPMKNPNESSAGTFLPVSSCPSWNRQRVREVLSNSYSIALAVHARSYMNGPSRSQPLCRHEEEMHHAEHISVHWNLLPAVQQTRRLKCWAQGAAPSPYHCCFFEM